MENNQHYNDFESCYLCKVRVAYVYEPTKHLVCEISEINIDSDLGTIIGPEGKIYIIPMINVRRRKKYIVFSNISSEKDFRDALEICEKIHGRVIKLKPKYIIKYYEAIPNILLDAIKRKYYRMVGLDTFKCNCPPNWKDLEQQLWSAGLTVQTVGLIPLTLLTIARGEKLSRREFLKYLGKLLGLYILLPSGTLYSIAAFADYMSKVDKQYAECMSKCEEEKKKKLEVANKLIKEEIERIKNESLDELLAKLLKSKSIAVYNESTYKRLLDYFRKEGFFIYERTTIE